MTNTADPDIIIHAGVPGLGYEAMEDGSGGYPSTAVDMVKLLREGGVVADYDRPPEERSELTHKAADMWLPILEVVKDLGIGVLGGCIVELVKDPRTRVHVKVGRRRNGQTTWIEASGERDDVVKTIDEFLSHEDDG